MRLGINMQEKDSLVDGYGWRKLFLTLFKIFTRYKTIALPLKCVVGSAVITTVEFAVGMVVNVKLKLNVWDYTNMRFNLFGQICPFYSLLWGLLTVPISFICKK